MSEASQSALVVALVVEHLRTLKPMFTAEQSLELAHFMPEHEFQGEDVERPQ